MKTIPTVEELFRQFKDVALFHAMSTVGAVTDIASGQTFTAHIQHAIDSSRTEKLFGFSIQFNKGPLDERVYGPLGIGIKSGIIFRHYREDSGKTNKSLGDQYWRASDDIDEVIRGIDGKYNEYALLHIEPCCVYWYKGIPAWSFPRPQIVEGCRRFRLPLLELSEAGLKHWGG